MLAPRLRQCLAIASISAIAIPATAFAQSASSLPEPAPVLPFDFSVEDISVADRYRPDYEPVGINMGGAVLRPSTTAGIGYNANVFGFSVSEIDGFYAFARPRLQMVSGEAGQRFISLSGGADLRRYFDVDHADETGLDAIVDARLPLGGGVMAEAGGSAQRKYERQESGSFPGAALAPIRYNDLSGYARLRTGGSRVRFTGAVDYTKLDFTSARSATTGALLDQSHRDREIFRGSGRIEGSLSGAISGYVQGSIARIDYANSFVGPGNPNRDGNRYDILAGVLFTAAKLRGSISVGYVGRSYKAGSYKDFGGISISSELLYALSGLTTLKASAERRIIETGELGSTGAFRTAGTFGVDHELRRNVILSANVAHERISYRALDRSDRITSIGGQAQFLVSRQISLFARADYVDRTSKGVSVGPSFERPQVQIGAMFKF